MAPYRFKCGADQQRRIFGEYHRKRLQKLFKLLKELLITPPDRLHSSGETKLKIAGIAVQDDKVAIAYETVD